MVFTPQPSIILLSFFVSMLSYNLAFGQTADPMSIQDDTMDVYFEKIILDGNVSYRNETTNEFITQSEYIMLCEPSMYQSNHTHDYWECDRINPYKDVVLSTPFKIEFDQTTFTHPIDDDIVVTSRFGRRRRGPHRGLDLDLVTGDYVKSVLPGKVRFVGYSSGHGKTVVVRHANEVETVYAHLSAYNVEVNDIITEGQIIGKGGNTGNSRGSHLHLEVRYKGVCIHPEYVFNFDGSRSIRGSTLWVSNAWKTPRFHSSYRQSDVIPLHTEDEAIASQNAEPVYHKVRSGDTLSHLAERYNLGLRDICNLNKISKSSTLRIGQILQVR